MVDREGKVTQLAPFNLIAWHAGQSSYKGRRGVNGFGIGIEMVGPGQMTSSKPGFARAWFGEDFPIDKYDIRRMRTPAHGDGWWMPFTEPQVRMTIALCKALVAAYHLKDITTHWAISPKRKVDPNPLFPLELCRELALGKAAGPMGLA
ncbi:N-acetylmuramoyl-L-alanine amidase [Rhodomicrobium sp. R_RK_3]|uniref:N-acetylmuramoyl-L-alanine amidase n=1 Tax=Rhodomicrobium sp. R_RK_3 TaxID=2029567 RepID=UPI001482756E|nr:N-acetylmuramoyl-L-alanine amidase [Rhodomicrobium sp. R_RK_3]